MNKGSSMIRRRPRRGSRVRKIGPALATFAVLVGGGAPLTIMALSNGGMNLPGMGPVSSLMAMLEDRSPGERTAAELNKTKSKFAEAPTQRALGKIVQPQAKELPKSFVQAITPTPPVPVIAPPAVPAAAAPPVLAGLVPNSLPIPPVGGVIASPGGGGGGGGGGGTPPTSGTPETPTNPPPVPAVPEPGTWAMMLLGFGLAGWSFRRRRPDPKAALPA